MAENKPDPTKSAAPGEWYLVVSCKGCGRNTVLAHDKDAKIASGAVRVQISDHGRINVKCSACGEMHSYIQKEITSVQA